MPAGRPPKITAQNRMTFADPYMRELKDGFRMGYNNAEACLNANISERIFYEVIANNKKLKEYFELLQKNVNMIAKTNIAKKIVDQKDSELSKWWSERKNKSEFSTRTENTGADGKDLVVKVTHYGDKPTK